MDEKHEKQSSGMKVDDWLEKIAKKPSPKYSIFVFSSTLIWIINSYSTYVSVFAGILPDEGDFTCISDECSSLVNDKTNLSTVCKLLYVNKSLELGVDLKITPQRSSFAIDFEMFCDKEEKDHAAMKTLISSIYFAGSFVGLLTGGVLYDSVGRKVSFFFGNTIAITASVVGTFCHSYVLLIVIRFFQGYGNLLAETGVYVLSMELVPARYRNLMNGFTQSIWCIGYLIGSLLGYLITDWNYLFLSCALLQLVVSVPVFFLIESPRFYMIKGNKDAARATLETIARMNGSKLTAKDIHIEEDGHLEDKVATIQQLREFVSYPVMMKETGIQMFAWGLLSMSFYGFNFGWGSIIPNLYLGYVLAAVGETIAYILGGWLIAYKGRRLSMIVFFLGCITTFLLPIINVDLGKGWSLESIICLVSLSFVSAGYSGIYLFTSELAPTSHRGMIFALCSSAARLGSFLGPFILNNLRDLIGKGLSFGLLAVLAFFAFLGMLYLVDTHEKPIPDVPEDVDKRRSEYKLKFW